MSLYEAMVRSTIDGDSPELPDIQEVAEPSPIQKLFTLFLQFMTFIQPEETRED